MPILSPSTLDWLVSGDASLAYQVKKYLYDKDDRKIQSLISNEGFGKRYLDAQNPDGHWGIFYYQPKWTSTHYTLLDLRNLEIPSGTHACKSMVTRMFDACQLPSGGLNLAKSPLKSDICVDGMILNYASYFTPEEQRLEALVAHLLDSQKPDGGFTWDVHRDVGDLDTTLCVAEGFSSYLTTVITDTEAVLQAKRKANEFLLKGLDFPGRYSKLMFPYRYHYSTLRSLEYLSAEERILQPYRVEVLAWMQAKARGKEVWNLEGSYPGRVHFVMEEKQAPSRWITLKMLLIQKRLSGNQRGIV